MWRVWTKTSAISNWNRTCKTAFQFTHWDRLTHICVNKPIFIGSDNGLSPGRRQAIIWTNAGILLIKPLWTHFGEIIIEIHTFSFKKMHLKIPYGKWRPFWLGLIVLRKQLCVLHYAYTVYGFKLYQWTAIRTFNSLVHQRFDLQEAVDLTVIQRPGRY